MASPLDHGMRTESEKRKWDQVDFAEGSLPSSKLIHMNSEDRTATTASSTTVRSRGSSEGSTDGSSQTQLSAAQRRKEQNRAAQRAFRERKERYVKELEEKIKTMQEQHAKDSQRLQKENEELRALVKQMESEIYTLKGASMAFDVAMKKLREASVELPSLLRDSPSPSHQSVVDSIHHDDCLTSVGSNASPSSSRSSLCELAAAAAENEEFAESKVERFDHTPDPVVYTNVKLIPCSQVWDHLSEHPKFDELDLDLLCEEMKKKAKCSGSGAVIEEHVLEDLVRRLTEHKA